MNSSPYPRCFARRRRRCRVRPDAAAAAAATAGRLRGTTRRRLLSLGADTHPRAGPDTGRGHRIRRDKTRATRGRRRCRWCGTGNGARRGRGRSARGRARGGASDTCDGRGRPDDRQDRRRSRRGCRSGGRRRNGSQARPVRQRRPAGAIAGLATGASSTGFVDQEDTNFLDVKRNVVQRPAEEVLKSLHRILHKVCAELLQVLKEFERSNKPIDSPRLGPHRSRSWLR